MIRLACALALLLTPLAAVAEVPFADKEWIELETPHFTIWSALSEKRTLEMGAELEGFRSIVTMLTSASVDRDVIPTRIYAFPGPAPSYGLSKRLGGFFRAGMRSNDAVIRPSGGQLIEVLFHEYAHFLMRNQDQTVYPTWYSEGFAVLLSTIKVDGKRFEIGGVPKNYQYTLSDQFWMSFDRILDTQATKGLNTPRTHQFYAQSWALVHYLSYGREGHKFPEEMTRYLSAVEAGTTPQEAFETSFGLETVKLRRKLRRYLGRDMRRLVGHYKEAVPTSEFAVRELPRAKVLTELGWLAFKSGEKSTAREAFEAALALNPDDPRAHSGVGDLHSFADEATEAEAAYERALAAAPDDILSLVDSGEHRLRRAQKESDSAERERWSKLARRQFAKAHRLGGNQPETLWAYGSSFLVAGQHAEKGLDTLQLAHELLPSNPTIAWSLAMALAEQGEHTEALQLARRVITWAHSDASEEQTAFVKEQEERVASTESEAPGADR